MYSMEEIRFSHVLKAISIYKKLIFEYLYNRKKNKEVYFY